MGGAGGTWRAVLSALATQCYSELCPLALAPEIYYGLTPCALPLFWVLLSNISAALQCQPSFLYIPHGLVLQGLQTVGPATLDKNTSLSKAEL